MEIITYHQNLKEVIEALTTKYHIEQIYINTYEGKTTPFELIILVGNKYVRTLDDLVPRILNTIREYPQYKLMCYIAFQAKDKIRAGNLFLFTSCQPKKLIYKKENSDFVPIPKNMKYSTCKALSMAFRDHEQQKVIEFKEGYYYFKEKRKYGLASFMLHQAMELTYRYLELLIIGKERITHSIRIHHLYLKRISIVYTEVFDEEEESDILLLRALDDSYQGARYENDFHIHPDILKQLELKMEILHEKAVLVFEYMTSSFEQQYVTPSSIYQKDDLSNKTIPMKFDDNNYLKEAIAHVKDSISGPVNIYVFGHRFMSFNINTVIKKHKPASVREDYFNLLVISKKDIRKQIISLQTELNDHSKASFLLLSFTQDQAQKQLDNNNPYFHEVLQEKKALLYKSLEWNNWSFHEKKGIRTKEDTEKMMKQWYTRENNASGFFNGGIGIENSEEATIKVLLYNKAIKQAALGLLEFFVGYTPYRKNLNHLYNLCCSFWYFPNDIFPRFTEEDKRHFNEFIQIPKDVLQKRRSYIDWDETFLYEARCERFLKECSKRVRETFTKELELYVEQ
ncbi:hypothetical protein ACG2LH_05625 [Zhouia sp. PK063]|uniref:hypothetical protein n=1 Tax=Zhouia sp. PK063 TaxID=3373602 RepID=UPI00378D0E62